MLPSENQVFRFWKQESLSFKLQDLSLRAQCSTIEKIHDKNLVSGRLKADKRIEKSHKWQQIEVETAA